MNDRESWECATAGKELEGFRITLTKVYRDKTDNTITEHNVSYDFELYGNSILGEVLFSDLHHDTEDRSKLLRYKIESRVRKNIFNLNNNYRHL